MTAEEMLYRAEVGYDIITGHAAEGISKKEWSTFLTGAQMDVVKIHLPTSPTLLTFELTELLKNQFSELVSYTQNVDHVPGVNLPNSYLFEIPDNYMYGLLGSIKYKDKPCLDGVYTKVKPISYNYYDLNVDNPYKEVNDKMAWRLVTSSTGQNKKQHDVIAKYEPSVYKLTYLKIPDPIIVYEAEFNSDDSEIQGVKLSSLSASMHCEMNELLHDNIVEKAILRAQVAMGDAQSAQLTGAVISQLH